MLPRSAIRFMAYSIANRLKRERFLRYLFDLTTTAQWRGPAVGIVRVEQELARRAHRHLGNNVAFCLYDSAKTAIVTIDDSVALDLIEGRIRVDIPDKQAARVAESPVRRRARLALLSNTTVYYLFQRARGRSLTREEVLQIQARELPRNKTEPAREREAAVSRGEADTITLDELPHHQALLDADTTIISGGLDWQYKNLRALWQLKKKYRFSYCAVVYDLIAVQFPHFVIPGYVELLTDYFGELLWLADQTLCISQTTRTDWLSHACDVGAEPVPSRVFPLGCDLSPHAGDSNIDLPAALNGKQFALYVSTIEPRKNHYMLYQALEEGIRTKQLDAERDRLVLVGRRGWATEDLLHEITTNPLTKDTIIILHDVSDKQLAGLYQRCSLVLFPSMYEGFGLPLAEALSYGKPCLASNAGALSEIGGDLVMRLDPKDTLAWTRTIGQLMSSPAELKLWGERIDTTYRPVTWDDAAHHFFDALSEPNCDTHHRETMPAAS